MVLEREAEILVSPAPAHWNVGARPAEVATAPEARPPLQPVAQAPGRAIRAVRVPRTAVPARKSQGSENRVPGQSQSGPTAMHGQTARETAHTPVALAERAVDQRTQGVPARPEWAQTAASMRRNPWNSSAHRIGSIVTTSERGADFHMFVCRAVVIKRGGVMSEECNVCRRINASHDQRRHEPSPRQAHPTCHRLQRRHTWV